MPRNLICEGLVVPKKLAEYLEKLKKFALKYNFESLSHYIESQLDEKYFETIRDIESRYPGMKERMIKAGKINR